MPNDFDLFIRRDFDPAAERHAGFSNSLLCRAVAAYGIPRERAEALSLLRTEKGKPFFKDSKSNTSGLGLGIYIIKSTLETQGLELDYIHQNNQNIYIIKGVVSQKNLKDENG